MIFDKYVRALSTPRVEAPGCRQHSAHQPSDGVQVNKAGQMGRLTGMLTGKRSQALAAALAIGATALTLSAGPAEAKDNNKMCTFISRDGMIHFMLPGEVDVNGDTGDRTPRICQADGTWRSVGSGPATVREVRPGPVREPREPRGRGGR